MDVVGGEERLEQQVMSIESKHFTTINSFTWSDAFIIAKGAALMSGTTYDIEFVTGCYELQPNNALSRLLFERLREAGPPAFTDEEQAFARQLQATFNSAGT